MAGTAHGPQGGIGCPTPPDVRWVSRFVEWGLQGILRCHRWGVVVKVRRRDSVGNSCNRASIDDQQG